jgi:hypothetical protein
VILRKPGARHLTPKKSVIRKNRTTETIFNLDIPAGREQEEEIT